MYASRMRHPKHLLAWVTGGVGGSALTQLMARTSPMLGSLALLGALVAGGIFLMPEIGLMLTAIVIPIERLGRFTNDESAYTVSLMRIVGTTTLAAYLLHAGLRRWKLWFGLPMVLYAAYWAYGVFTLTWADDRIGGIRAVSAILGNLLFLFLIVNMVRDWKMVKRLTLLWLAASVLIGLFTMYQWHTGKRSMEESSLGSTSARFDTVLKDNSEWESLDQVERALGPTSSPAVYAINMILTLPFLFFLYRTSRSSWQQAGLVLAGLVVMYNIFLTNTRAAILIAAFAVVFCLCRRMVRMTPAVILVGLLALVAALAVTPSAVWHRVLDASNYTTQRSGTLRARLMYWTAGVHVAEDYWYCGTGIGNETMMPKYANIEGPELSSVHNEYLNTLMETGLFGWTLFFSFIALLLVTSFRTARAFKARGDRQEQYWFMVACQIAMISVLMFAVQVDVYHFPLKGWWLVSSLTIVMQQMARKEQHGLAGFAGERMA